MARDYTVEWSVGKPPEFYAELWNVEATVMAIIEAAAYENPDLPRLLAALAGNERPDERA